MRHKIKNERAKMNGVKAELIFLIVIAIILALLFLGGAWLQGWLEGVTV